MSAKFLFPLMLVLVCAHGARAAEPVGRNGRMTVIERPAANGLPFLAVTALEAAYDPNSNATARMFRARRLCRHFGYADAFLVEMSWHGERGKAVYVDTHDAARLVATIQSTSVFPPGAGRSEEARWATFSRVGCSGHVASSPASEAGDGRRAPREVFDGIVSGRDSDRHRGSTPVR